MSKVRASVLVLVLLVFVACERDGGIEDDGASPSPGGDAGIELTITSPPDGDVINGNTVELGVEHSGFSVVSADGDTSGKTGHFHVFIDRDPVEPGTVIERGPDIVHSTDNPIVIPGLAPGEHRFVLVAGDGNHVRMGEASSEVTVDVKGPSIDVTAPESVPQGQKVQLSVATNGLTVVAAPEGKYEEASGHFHVLIDKPLPEFGKAIPADQDVIHTTSTSIELDLSVGDHIIWVVVGDGGHVPFRPLVADKVTVKVT